MSGLEFTDDAAKQFEKLYLTIHNGRSGTALRNNPAP